MIWVTIVLTAWRLWTRGTMAGTQEWHIALAISLCVAVMFVMGRRHGSSRKPRMRVVRGHMFFALAWGLVVINASISTALLLRRPAAQAVEIWQKVMPATGNSPATPPIASGQSSGDWLAEEGTRRSLPRNTNLKLGSRPEVFLRLDDSSRNRAFSERTIYLTALRFDRYRDASWECSPSPTQVLLPDDKGMIALAESGVAEGVWHTVVLSASAKRRTPLVALQGAFQTEGLASLERWSDGMFLLPLKEEKQSGYRYRACSAPIRLADLPSASTTGSPLAPSPSSLEFPDTPLNQRISALAQTITQGGDPLDTLRRIEAYLHEGYRYSLRSRNPRNLDPMENFLFEEKTGHCEYFATAGALLARACGIPTRISYGWAGGTWFEHANWFVFRADEAHAWVEAWIDGHGWVVMEPTPEQARFEQIKSDSREEPLALPESVDDPLEWQSLSEDIHTETPFSWAILILGSVLAAIAWFLLRPRARITEISSHAAAPWRETHVAHYLDLWKSLCRKHHPQRDLQSTTLRQQLDWWDPRPEFADDLWQYHYQLRYERKPARRRAERMLLYRIRAWSSELRNKS